MNIKFKILALFSIFWILLTPNNVFAAFGGTADQLGNYQGYVTDNDGIPITGTKNIQIDAYSDSSCSVSAQSSSLYSASTSIQKGIFNVKIDYANLNVGSTQNDIYIQVRNTTDAITSDCYKVGKNLYSINSENIKGIDIDNNNDGVLNVTEMIFWNYTPTIFDAIVSIGQTDTDTSDYALHLDTAAWGAVLTQNSTIGGNTNVFKPDYPTLNLYRESSYAGATMKIGNQTGGWYMNGTDTNFYMKDPTGNVNLLNMSLVDSSGYGGGSTFSDIPQILLRTPFQDGASSYSTAEFVLGSPETYGNEKAYLYSFWNKNLRMGVSNDSTRRAEIEVYNDNTTNGRVYIRTGSWSDVNNTPGTSSGVSVIIDENQRMGVNVIAPEQDIHANGNIKTNASILIGASDSSISDGSTGQLILSPKRNVGSWTSRALALTSYNGTSDINRIEVNGNNIQFSSVSNGAALTITDDNNIGIDETEPTIPLAISDPDTGLDSPATGELSLKSDGTETLRSQPTRLDIYTDLYLAGTFYQTSTREAKENISYLNSEQYTEALDMIKNLDIARFNYKKDESKKMLTGFIAEETPKILLTEDGKAVDIYSTLGTTIAALKEENKLMEEKHNEQEKELEELKNEIKELRESLPFCFE